MENPGRAISAVVLLIPSLALAGPVTVVGTVVTDNGDGDGIPDAGETLDLRLVVRNDGATDLTGVTATLLTVAETAHLGCSTPSIVSIGSLLAGETRESPVGLSVTISPAAERTDLYETLQARFDVRIASDQLADAGRRDGLTFELDLDVAGGSGPSSYFEDFESAITDFGDFVAENLDEGQYDDCADYGSAGYRCQRHVPWCNSGCDMCYDSTGLEDRTDNVLGTSDPYTELFFWHIEHPGSPDGGRAFSGLRSLHVGLPETIGSNTTTPTGTLEAMRTGTPIHVGWNQVDPTLTFKHQLSLVDDRTAGQFGTTLNRAIVQARLLDGLGAPAGDWTTLRPYRNGYHIAVTNFYSNAMFDPVDDGSLEWDLFPGTDRLGPSSTCAPNRTFTHLGHTRGPFQPAMVGAGDGPGLQGAYGPGTWVETSVSLAAYRGRSIQLRFLTSFAKVGAFETWEDWASGLDLEEKDDGWWIDDVSVSDTLTTPAAATIDLNDNSGLPALPDADSDGVPDACDLCPGTVAGPQFDSDFDGFGNACDCDVEDAAVYPGAIELLDGVDNQCSGDVGYGEVDEFSQPTRFVTPTRLDWGGIDGATSYQVVRSLDRFFAGACTCQVTADPWWDDAQLPPTGRAFHYLVRVIEPILGEVGSGSGGLPREGRCLIDICAP